MTLEKSVAVLYRKAVGVKQSYLISLIGVSPKFLDIISDYYVHERCGADVYPQGLAARLEFIGDGDVVAKHAITGHFHSYYARQHRTGVKSNPHLQQKKDS